MNDSIKVALDEIQEAKPRIEHAINEQMKVWMGQTVEEQPLLLHCPLSKKEGEVFPKHSYKDIHYDCQKNLEYHIPSMLTSVRGGTGAVPSARANMGCGIYAAWFGLVQNLYDDKMPWLTTHLSKDELKDMSVDDLKITREFEVGLDHMKYMAECLNGTGARIYPMDLQGPVDLAHLVYGDNFFYDLYDDTDFVSHLLDLCVEAIVRGSKLCLDAIPGSNIIVPHYNEVVLPREIGGIKTSEDTSTLLSGEHIKSYAMVSTNKVLERNGGGYVHYCGRNEHLLNEVLSSRHVHGINFGNPEMHDIEQVLRRCADTGKILYSSVPHSEGESWLDYFTRLLSASYKDGKFHLLLGTNCSLYERDQVLDDWRRAQDMVREKY